MDCAITLTPPKPQMLAAIGKESVVTFPLDSSFSPLVHSKKPSVILFPIFSDRVILLKTDIIGVKIPYYKRTSVKRKNTVISPPTTKIEITEEYTLWYKILSTVLLSGINWVADGRSFLL